MSCLVLSCLVLTTMRIRSRCAEALLRKFSGWLCTSKHCTLAAAFCLCVAGLVSNFLGVHGPTAVVTGCLSGLGLLLTIIAVGKIISLSFPTDYSETRQLESASHVKQTGSNQGPCDCEQGANIQTSEPHHSKHEPQPFLSPLSSLSSHVGLSFRSSRIPV